MPDPRRWDREDWRDKTRREWDMKRLHLDIDTPRMEVTDDNNRGLWNCFEDYATMQTICRGDGIDNAAISFVLRTKFVDADMDIYERTIPVGLDEFCTKAINGVAKQRAAAEADVESVVKVDEGFVAPNPELQPDDFYKPEENPLDFDPKDLANGDLLVAWQGKMLTTMSTNRVVSRNPQFQAASREQLDDLRTGAVIGNLLADDILSKDRVREFADFIRARGAKNTLAPTMMSLATILALSNFPGWLSYQALTGLSSAVQITGLAWMVAQCYGYVSRVPGFDHKHPIYRRQR